MGRLAWLVGLLLVAGLLVLPRPACALQFGIIAGGNTNYAVGVMGGASSAGSGIPRQGTAADNVVIYRASLCPPPVCITQLTATVPGTGIIFPTILLVSGRLFADPGLVPFAPAGTALQDGAW